MFGSKIGKVDPASQSAPQAPHKRARRGHLATKVVACIAVMALATMGLCACGSSKIDTSDIVGKWYVTSGTESGLEAENFEILGFSGIYAFIDLDEDGTGTFDLSAINNGSYDVTWKATSTTEGLMTIDDVDFSFIVTGDDMEMDSDRGNLFLSRDKPGNASSSTSGSSASGTTSGSSTSGSTSGSSTGTTSGSTVTFGNSTVGYISAPSNWVDTTNLIDAQTISDYAAVQCGDPSSQYNSSLTGGTAYAKCITFLAYYTNANDVANSLQSQYLQSSSFSGVQMQTTTFNGFDSYLITANVPSDNLNLAVLVIGESDQFTVAITMDCGSTQADADEVMGIVQGWSAF